MALSMIYSVAPRRVLSISTVYTGEFLIHSIGKIPSLTISPLPHRRSRCYCRSSASTASPAGVSSFVAEGARQSTNLVSLEYAELNLTDKFCEEVGHVRIRQHVNPLRSALLVPAEVPNWNEVYKDTSLPLMVDIGSGSGRFLMYLAKKNPESKNYLGLEIRPKLVTRAVYWVNELGLRNIHFMFANVTISFERIVSTYPGPVVLVSILCPDPHFKKKHHKRRVVQKPLVQSIVDRLARGGQFYPLNIVFCGRILLHYLHPLKVFIQSDVFEVALDMRNHFDAMSNELVHIDSIDSNVLCDSNGWVLKNPLGIRTEREIHAEFEGSSIYRRVYEKVRHEFGST